MCETLDIFERQRTQHEASCASLDGRVVARAPERMAPDRFVIPIRRYDENGRERDAACQKRKRRNGRFLCPVEIF